MKFEEVLPALREGKKVKRGDCLNCVVLNGGKLYDINGDSYWLGNSDIMTETWEIIEEPKKKKLYAYKELTGEVKFFFMEFYGDSHVELSIKNKRAPEYDLEF